MSKKPSRSSSNPTDGASEEAAAKGPGEASTPDKAPASPKAPAKRRTRRTKTAKSATTDTTPTKESVEAPSGKERSSLPAFGFAADLLGKRDNPADSGADETASNLDTDRLEAAGEQAASAADASDPERIFQFAGGLESALSEEEQPKVRRLATWVTFDLADEIFAMPVEPVREILRVETITRVPHAPRPIRGVTNLRGRVIPVIDLRLRIGLSPTELGRSTRIIVVAARGRLIGLLADAVQQVIHLDLDRIQPPPDDVLTVQSDYIRGVYHLEDHLVLLLDIERALVVRDAPDASHTAAASPST